MNGIINSHRLSEGKAGNKNKQNPDKNKLGIFIDTED